MAKTLAEKLLLKPGQGAALIGAPRDQAGLFGAELTNDPSKAAALLVYTATARALGTLLPAAVKKLGPEARLWICYPKAGQLGTDLNRDVLHGLAAEQGWTAVRQIALDEVWSALAFKRAAK